MRCCKSEVILQRVLKSGHALLLSSARGPSSHREFSRRTRVTFRRSFYFSMTEAINRMTEIGRTANVKKAPRLARRERILLASSEKIAD